MNKQTYQTGLELTDKQWDKLKKFFPNYNAPHSADKCRHLTASASNCLIRLLRSGARDKDIPKHFPSGGR
ncbi:MAG: transposase [Planctomycetaceae bacterium]|jgi:Spy/CpxP family protein refolding chaperone|nr:transposase [Planctomycetaceae bacterium]